MHAALRGRGWGMKHRFTLVDDENVIFEASDDIGTTGEKTSKLDMRRMNGQCETTHRGNTDVGSSCGGHRGIAIRGNRTTS